MNGLGIEDVTIGYSSTGAAKYVSDLNTAAITETESIITNGTETVKDVLQSGWQGDACDSFCNKLSEACENLKVKLKEMETVFNATMAAQEETYYASDEQMADSINSTQIL